MSACGELRPLLGGYVLEGLEPDETEAVRAHLRSCPDCAAEHASLSGLPRLLDLAATSGHAEEPLPDAFEEALLDRFARDRGRRPPRRRRLPRLTWTRPRVAVASALVAAAAGAGAVALLEDDRPAAPATARSYMVALKPAVAEPGARARIALYRVRGGTGVHLWATGLPAGSDRVYEMLCERGGWSASAGTFRADARGRVDIRLTTAARVGEYDRVRIVRRAGGGRTEVVLAGKLF